MFAIILASVLLIGLLALWLHRRRADTQARSFVCIGDLWEFFDKRNAGLYEVEGPNLNTEAGADSWKMRHSTTGRRRYMHHDARTEGRWILCMRDGQPMRRVCDIPFA
jgi:hypothetical protein